MLRSPAPRSRAVCFIASLLSLAPIIQSRAGLVAWWKFDEASGTTAADSSGAIAPIPATLTGGATFQPAAGKFGGAMYLDGASGQANAGDRTELEFPVGQSFSLAIWYKSDGDETLGEFQTNNGLITKGYHQSGVYDTSGYYQLQINGVAGNTNTFFQFDSRIGSSEVTPFRFPGAITAPDVVNNAWHHFVSVVDRGTNQCRLYVDNALYGTKSIVAGAGGGQWAMGVNTSPLIIGNHSARFTKGWFDDGGVWNDALTPAQIASIYNFGIGGTDTDNDGLSDVWETTYFGNLTQTASGNPDLDGLTNLQEQNAGTNPTVADTDGDGLTDGQEVLTYLTNPLVADTDGDGLSDGAEVNGTPATNPKLADTDGDGLTDSQENTIYGTNPTLVDTDGDTYSDAVEIAAETDPLLATSVPTGLTVYTADHVLINEFVADNLQGIADEDLNSPAWLELRNPTGTAVSLNGWALTDDVLVPNKWLVPNVSLAAGGYLRIFASGKNRNAVGAGLNLHTNFKISKDNGYLALNQPNGTGGWNAISMVQGWPQQYADRAYGLFGAGTALVYGWLETATPAAANSNAGYLNRVKDTSFSIDRGLYSAPQAVVITSPTNGATISYTTNGSEPTPTNGIQIPSASPTVSPAVTVNVTTTTIIRARAWKAGRLASDIDTQSYIFPTAVLAQDATYVTQPTAVWGHDKGDADTLDNEPDWSMDPRITGASANAADRCTEDSLKAAATISVTLPWADMFGTNGIYIAGEGIDKFGSFEMINPEGNKVDPNAVKGFGKSGYLHIFGGTSTARWKSDKLSMGFKFTDGLDYRPFGKEAIDKHTNMVLDARLNQVWNHSQDGAQRNRGDFVRDRVMSDLQLATGGLAPHSKAVHVYLNGLYWGIYTMHEKPDEHFQTNYQGGDNYEWDVVKHGVSHPGFVVSGQAVNRAIPMSNTNSTANDNWRALVALAGADLSVAANYNALAAKLDIDDFINYMLVNFYGANNDWAHQNWYASYRRTDPAAKWRFHTWDAEHVFRTATEDATKSATSATATSDTAGSRGPTYIHQRLAGLLAGEYTDATAPSPIPAVPGNAEYRRKFADAVHKYFFNGGLMTPSVMASFFDARLQSIDDAIRGESARWGDSGNSGLTAPSGELHLRFSNYTAPSGTVYQSWNSERLRILNTILQGTPNRTTQGLVQLKLRNLYPSIDAPVYAQHGGSVAANYGLVISNPNAGAAGTVYFTLDGSDPRLEGGAISPAAIIYTSTPVVLSASKTVNARVLNGSTWSALNSAYFSVGAVPASAANLVISEVNYNPASSNPSEVAQGYTDNNLFEYIEIMNIGASAVDLSDVQFTAGVTYRFSASPIKELAPGDRVLVVKDTAAFPFRYGSGKPVAGAFELDSNLSNSGETVTLSRVVGSTITELRTFKYNDKAPWPGGTDGDGWSMTLNNPTTGPDHTKPENWRPSTSIGGSPGAGDTTGLAVFLTNHTLSSASDDDDHDGYSNAIEYVMGTNPKSSNGNLTGTVVVQPLTVNSVPGDYLTVTIQRAGGTDDVAAFAECSDNLDTWVPGIRVSATPNLDGKVTEVWRSSLPVGGKNRYFIHLKVVSN